MTRTMDQADLTWTHSVSSSTTEEQRWRPSTLLAVAGMTAATFTVSGLATAVVPTPVITAIPASAAIGIGIRADHAVGAQVRALKLASGLTWAQFAGLFGVTRRAVHFWAEGGRISADHVARLERVRQALDSAGGSTPAQTREALFTVDGRGITPFASLIAEVNRSTGRLIAEGSPLGFEETSTGLGVPGEPVATEDFHGVTPRAW
jgi:transcriptional regulator with XRE-family HTH domain